MVNHLHQKPMGSYSAGEAKVAAAMALSGGAQLGYSKAERTKLVKTALRKKAREWLPIYKMHSHARSYTDLIWRLAMLGREMMQSGMSRAEVKLRIRAVLHFGQHAKKTTNKNSQVDFLVAPPQHTWKREARQEIAVKDREGRVLEKPDNDCPRCPGMRYPGDAFAQGHAALSTLLHLFMHLCRVKAKAAFVELASQATQKMKKLLRAVYDADGKFTENVNRERQRVINHYAKDAALAEDKLYFWTHSILRWETVPERKASCVPCHKDYFQFGKPPNLLHNELLAIKAETRFSDARCPELDCGRDMKLSISFGSKVIAVDMGFGVPRCPPLSEVIDSLKDGLDIDRDKDYRLRALILEEGHVNDFKFEDPVAAEQWEQAPELDTADDLSVEEDDMDLELPQVPGQVQAPSQLVEATCTFLGVKNCKGELVRVCGTEPERWESPMSGDPVVRFAILERMG